MKAAYTVVINKNTHIVYVPDFDISTEGTDIENCIEMAREAIGLTGISYIPCLMRSVRSFSNSSVCKFIAIPPE